MKNLQILFLIFSSLIVFSQEKNTINSMNNYCSTDEAHLQLMKDYNYNQKFSELNTNWQKWILDGNSKNNTTHKTSSGQTSVLPVIFHLMINGSSPITSSITKSNLQQSLNVLNLLFAGQASGSKSAGVNTNIQFCLAEIDNFGNGISTYTHTSIFNTLNNSSQVDVGILSNIVQGTGKYPTTKYINIYVVEDIVGNTAGFAYLPSSHGSSFDGIYIEAQFLLSPLFTNDLSYNMTVLTHEMGHYLGLFHTFGICNSLSQTCSCYNNNCLFDGDMICDTPPDFSQNSFTCSNPPNTCNTDNTPSVTDGTHPLTDVNDLIDNYMDYGNWNCQHTFTLGQKNRMNFMIDPVIGPRNSLLNSNVCNAVCVNNSCSVAINPITTTNVNGINLLNSLILNGGSVNFNFTANTCPSYYNSVSWIVKDLNTNTTFSTAITTNLNAQFYNVGNYRIICKAFVTNSNPLCYKSDTLDIKVLPPPVCPLNLDMANGWTQNNWQRFQYEGGWSRVNTSGGSFVFPTTTLSVLSSTVPNGSSNNDPFKIVNNLSSDPNFSTIPLPNGISNVMRVGKLISPTTSLTPGDASYVTYTFNPTTSNSKLRVYYLGMQEHDPLPAQGIFMGSLQTKTSYGLICKYEYKDISGQNIVIRGMDHTQSYVPYGKNDFSAGGVNWNVPSSSITSTSVMGNTYDKMTNWQYMDLDFTDYICSSPTITISFYAHSDNPNNLGYHHSYAYFGVTCLPGNFNHIDLNLSNVDIPCSIGGSLSCTKIQLPRPYTLSPIDNYYSYYNYSEMLNVKVRYSNDNINYSNTTNQYSLVYGSNGYFYPELNLCKPIDNHPYAYYEISYQTPCETVIDTLVIFHGFTHNVSCTPTSTVALSGGHFLNSGDQYVQLCNDSVVLSLSKPCWWNIGDPEPEYQWTLWGTQFIPGAVSPTLVVNSAYYNCASFVRLAKYIDPYCGTSSWIKSDEFRVSKLNFNNFNINGIKGPDECANLPITVQLNNVYEETGNSSIFCDSELNSIASQNPVVNSISFSFYSDQACTNQINASVGSSVLTYSFINALSAVPSPTLSGPLNTSFTFNNNGIYTTNGTLYVKCNVVRFGCTSSFTVPVTIKIKPAAVSGTITSSSLLCSSTTNNIIGDNNNVWGYQWEYSYNNNFSPLTLISGANTNTLSIPPSTFSSSVIYLRRKALGNSDCPNPAYSNTLSLNFASSSNINIVASSSVVCGTNTVSLSASGVNSYTWAPVIANTSSIVVAPTANTIYTVSGTNTLGCISSKTLAITVSVNPTVTATASQYTICAGKTTTLNASGASTYVWKYGTTSVSAISLTVAPSVTTTYTLIGTNLAGCTNTTTVKITVLANPTITASSSPSLICRGGNSTLTVSGASSYSWAPINSNLSTVVVSPTISTIYTITGTNTLGCISIKTLTISVSSNPTLTVTSPSSICAGGSANLVATGATVYSWMPGSYTTNSINVTPSSTTIYTVIGANSVGCISAPKTITLTLKPKPSLTVSPSSSIVCPGTIINISAAGANSYSWNIGSTSASISVSPSLTSVYSVTGTTNGCQSVENATVQIIPTSTLAIVPSSSVLCGTFVPVSFTVSPANSYTWTSSPSSPIIAGIITPNVFSTVLNSTTTFTVRSKTISGCINQGVITVTVLPLPTVTISGSNSLCAGSCATLTANGSDNYYWLNEKIKTTTTIVCPTVSTTYSVVATNSAGCSITQTVSLLVTPSPTILISPQSPTICSGSSINLIASGANSYIWNTGSLSSNITDTPNLNSVYSVTGTVNGCKSSAITNVTVKDCEIPCSIKARFTYTVNDCQLNISNYTFYNGSGNVFYNWVVRDLNGNDVTSIVTSTPTSSNPVFYFNNSNLPSGGYQICLNTVSSDGFCKDRYCIQFDIGPCESEPCELNAAFVFDKENCLIKDNTIYSSNTYQNNIQWNVIDVSNGNNIYTSSLNPLDLSILPNGQYKICIKAFGNNMLCEDEYCEDIELNCSSIDKCSIKAQYKFDDNQCLLYNTTQLSASVQQVTVNWKIIDATTGLFVSSQTSYSIFDTLDLSFLPSGAYKICIEIIANNGACSDEYCEEIIIYCSYESIKSQINVYPNPAFNFINVSWENEKPQLLKLYNMNGHLIWSSIVDENAKSSIIDIQNFNSGLYLLQISSDNKTFSRKININR